MASNGVHGAHCCQRHGCKYGEPYCPVGKSGGYEMPQKYPCEYCEEDIDGEGRDLAVLLNEMYEKGRASALQVDVYTMPEQPGEPEGVDCVEDRHGHVWERGEMHWRRVPTEDRPNDRTVSSWSGMLYYVGPLKVVRRG